MLESVLPAPALPAASVTPVLSSVMRLVAEVVLALGVSVAVQVTPLSLELTDDSVPLAMVRSALVKPLTASEKVKVTSEVSPIDSASSVTTMLTVGRTPSTPKAALSASEPAAPGAASVRSADVPLPFWIVPPLRLSAPLEK